MRTFDQRQSILGVHVKLLLVEFFICGILFVTLRKTHFTEYDEQPSN